VQAEVLHKAFRGADILYTLRLASGTEVLSLVPSHHNHAIGEKIGIRLDADHVIAFKKHDECDDPACEIKLEQHARPITWLAEERTR
jgi:iron(III) transport system ATP-binding protein